MKIAFVHDWDVDYEQEFTWKDGLAAAIKDLATRHKVKFFVCADSTGRTGIIPHAYFPIFVSDDIKKDVAEFKPDVIICWGDCTRPNAKSLSELGIPMALCFAGGDVQGETNRYFDHFFVESQVYYDRLEVMGKSVSRAFGTNTEIFKPIKQAKLFDAVFPATYCEWKRHSLFAEAVKGLKTATAGWKYPDHEQWCYTIFDNQDNLTLPHISAESLSQLYGASRVCVVTSRSDGGSQRTVLEAMAMNLPVITMTDSDKTSEYVKDCGIGAVVDPDPKKIREAIEYWKDKQVNTRDFIIAKYSEFTYAKALEEGIKKICGKIYG